MSDERSGLLGRASVVAGGTLASRVLGAVRDIVIAATFTAASTDLFWMAFTIPNALRVLLGEGAVSGAFVPVLTEAREKAGAERARALFAKLAGSMALVLLCVSVLGVLLAEPSVALYASGFSKESFDRTVDLTRWVFPYIFFMGLAALATGALHSEKRFFAPAFAPLLLNVALIAAPFTMVGLAATVGLPPIGSLALGALLGGLLHLLAQLPALARVGMLRLPRPDWSDPYVRKAFRLMGPLLIALGVYQLNVALSRQFASYLPAGSLSYLYYGQRLVEIPQGMFALAIASAALPSISKVVAQGDIDGAKAIFRDGLALSLFVAIPSSIGLAVLAEPIVAVLFGRGAFGAIEIAETGKSLVLQALGVWAVASVRTIVPMFHALNDTRSPVWASGANLVVFGIAAISLYRPFGHVGLAAAISLAAVAQLITLLSLLRRKAGRLGIREVLVRSGRVFAASAAAGLAMGAIAHLGQWQRGAADLRNPLLLVAALTAGVVTFFASAKALGVPELEAFVAAIRRRLRR
ncbi:MAG: murein biosynthesis integral membrane protein MurJ [Polyangiaceae bacterium]|nr:murein biosynthesis integral membrane protein MurJ [Polyangiaceae bacterium]